MAGVQVNEDGSAVPYVGAQVAVVLPSFQERDVVCSEIGSPQVGNNLFQQSAHKVRWVEDYKFKPKWLSIVAFVGISALTAGREEKKERGVIDVPVLAGAAEI